LALLALAGCASPIGYEAGDLGRRDGGSGDLARVLDLAGVDLAGADLAAPIDLAVPRDFAGVDQASGADLASPVDLAGPPDLARPPDLAMLTCVPQTQPCDVICQNCGANLKCGLGMNGALACIQSGSVPVGSACGSQGVDDCIAGAVCATYSQTVRQCDYFCRSDGDCKNGGKCVYNLSANPPQMVCSEPITSCDPVAMTGCSAGACFLVTPDGETGCHQAGAGSECAVCTSDYDCQAGFACIGLTGTCPNGGCAPLCHAGMDGDCVGGETCHPVVYDQAGDTWANWGVCST
jgi:hypothetical protein